MQTLFAFNQCRKSNLLIARDQLKESAKQSLGKESPWMLKLDKVFDDQLNSQEPLPDDLPHEIKAQVVQEVATYHQQMSRDLKFLRARMLDEVEGVHKIFLWVLSLFLALADFETKALAKKQLSNQRSPLTYLTGKRSIEVMRKSLSTMDLPSWNDHQDRVSQWYKEIKKNNELESQLSSSGNDLESELKILRYIFKSVLWKSETFQNFFEEYDMGWVENMDVIKSLVNKTLKSISEKGATLAPLSYQWEDDKMFFENIFDATIDKEQWSEKLVASSAKNWEMDRIAQVDMILLKMALSEMINFPSIPVKVTINEYIEMSKRYSTPKSKKFINGILDVLANDLMADGTIKKSGRGLIDNK